MYLIFDTETTGLPLNWKAPLTDFDNWPRCVQLAWQIHDVEGKLVDVKNYIIQPDGYEIPYNASKIHGISTDLAKDKGIPLLEVLKYFIKDVQKSKLVIGHNILFDNNIIGSELLRMKMTNILSDFPCIDTKDISTNYCAIPGGKGGKYKWPTLSELHIKLFGEDFLQAHNASADVQATARCFLELIRLEIIPFEKVMLNKKQFMNFKLHNNSIIDPIDLKFDSYIAPVELENTNKIKK